jgi:hypothetical protein
MPSKAQNAREQERTPRNAEAERNVLGYFLRGGEWRDDVTAHDFACEREQTIWHAMREIHAAGDEIDVSRLHVELGEKKLNNVGGIGFLAELSEGCFSEMRIEPYIRKLHEATGQRAILHHAHILMTHVLSGDRTVEELIEMGAAAFASLQRSRNHQEPPPAVPQWPEPLDEAAFHGVAGDLVRAIEPHSESDPAALLLQFLVGWGSLAGRGPYILTEDDRHHTNLYTVIVGTTSKGRKGTSWGRIRAVLETVDEHWVKNCPVSGLGSGEALIDSLKEDHRRLVMESELARLLAIIAREGTTISSIFRQCWDSGEAHVTVRGKPAHVTGGHLSLIAHITRDELLRRLNDTEIANGFGNRFLWGLSRRSKKLPFGGGSINFGDISSRLSEATDFVRKSGNTRIRLDAQASDLWEQVYDDLSEGKPGLFGAVTGRAEPQVLRLALIYALLDRCGQIAIKHLRAALAVWRYCEASARFIWRDDLGDPTANSLLKALRSASAVGMTRWDINNHFSRHKTAEEIDRAIGVLMERGLIHCSSEQTAGRPTTRYWSV